VDLCNEACDNAKTDCLSAVGTLIASLPPGQQKMVETKEKVCQKVDDSCRPLCARFQKGCN